MRSNPALGILRDVCAWAIVLLFVFPIFWWILASFKPYTAIFNTTPVYWGFEPTQLPRHARRGEPLGPYHR
jgi:multiple sugar transport system permease protein